MDEPQPNEQSKESNETPARIRLSPSRNQKQRSRLRQAPESVPAVEPVTPPTPPPPTPEPSPVRRAKLKRSGQMHADLTAPLPDPQTPADEPEY